MTTANFVEAVMEWTITIEGRDAFGDLRQGRLSISKTFDQMDAGEIGLSIADGKRVMALLRRCCQAGIGHLLRTAQSRLN